MGIQMKINYISENNMFFYLKYINLFKYLLSVSHLGSKSTTNLLAPGQVNT